MTTMADVTCMAGGHWPLTAQHKAPMARDAVHIASRLLRACLTTMGKSVMTNLSWQAVGTMSEQTAECKQLKGAI